MEFKKADLELFIDQVRGNKHFGKQPLLLQWAIKDPERSNDVRLINWLEELLRANRGTDPSQACLLEEWLKKPAANEATALNRIPEFARILFCEPVMGAQQQFPNDSTWQAWLRQKTLAHLCFGCHFPKVFQGQTCPLCGD